MSADDRASIREIRAALPAEKQDLHMSDLVDERGDIADLREQFIQPAAREIRNAAEGNCASDDLLALSKNNDPFYIKPSETKQAQWYAGVDAAEGYPTTTPREMHYTMRGDDHAHDDRHGNRYVGTGKQWTDLQQSARLAGLLGKINPERRLDGNNTDSDIPSLLGHEQEPDWHAHWNPRINYSSPRAEETVTKATLHGDAGSAIEKNASAVARAVFSGVQFSGERRQPAHIEVWCEKSEVIPDRLPRGVGKRPAAHGEPSAKMCEKAVGLADERGQALVVVMLSDFDGKGADMPKSVARKIEIEAAVRDVEAHVFQAALTKEQAERLDLSFAPGTVPEGAERGSSGAKAFRTLREEFAAFAGEDGKIEVNALTNDHPHVLRDAIGDHIDPYRDDSLQDRLDAAVADERDRFDETVADRFGDERDDIEAAHDDLGEAVETFNETVENDDEIAEAEDEISDINDEIEDLRDERDERKDELRERMDEHRDDAGLKEKTSAYRDALDIDLGDTRSGFELDLPEADFDGRDDALLDTRRTWVEQLDAYREFDYRWEADE